MGRDESAEKPWFVKTWLLVLVLGLAAVLPSSVALGGEWIFDDINLILKNPDIHHLTNWKHWFTGHFFGGGIETTSRVPYWRPLVLASYAVDWRLGSGSPLIYHIINLILHAAATILSFFVLKRWLRAGIPAFAVTLLFALHPFRTESITWISGRPDPLMMVGVLMMVQGIAYRIRGHRFGFVLEIIGTMIGYLSKEHAIVMPIFALLEIWTSHQNDHRQSIKSSLRLCGPQVLFAFIYLGLRKTIVPLHLGIGLNWGFQTRLGMVLESIGRYAAILFWPHDLTLGAASIGIEDHTITLTPFYMVCGSCILVVFILIVGWLLKRRRYTALVSLFAFALVILPVSNVILPGHGIFVSPRFLYLPSFILAYIIGLGFVRIWRFNRVKVIILYGTAVISLLFFGIHAQRALVYRSADQFWTAEAEGNPKYHPALYHFTHRALKSGRPMEALLLAHKAFSNLQSTVAKEASLSFQLLALEAIARLLPDLDQPSLLAIHTFLDEIRKGEMASLELPAYGLRMRIRPDQTRKIAEYDETKLLMVRIGARVQQWEKVVAVADELMTTQDVDDQFVLALAQQAAQCHDFEFVHRVREILQHRGRVEEVQEIDELLRLYRLSESVKPPADIPFRAAFYSRALAWGKAYMVLTPYLDPEKAQALGIEPIVAEAAFRAGDEPTARKLLSSRPSKEVEDWIMNWKRSMQWVDAPLQPGEHPLPNVWIGISHEARP